MHPGIGGADGQLVNCPVAHSNAETPRNPRPLGLPGGIIKESLSAYSSDLEFVLFTPFLKVDGKEGDKLYAKYTTRTGNVSNLCRY